MKTYSNEELIQKAALAVSEITASGGVLLPEQQAAFLRMAQESQKILLEARVEPITKGQKVLDRVGMNGQFLRTGVEDDVSIYTDPATRLGKESKPNLGKIQLNAFKVTGETAVSWETLQRNVERDGFSDTIMQVMAKRAAFDIEKGALLGDVSNPVGSGFVGDNENGFMVRVPTGQRIDWAHAAFDRSIFAQLINKVNAKYRNNLDEFRFYVSHGIEMAYRQQLSAKFSTLGDTSSTENFALKAFGVPVVGVNAMPNNDGTGTDEGRILFCHPKNLIFAVEDEMRVTDKFDDYRDSLVIFMHMAIDWSVEEPNALASASGVKWSAVQ